MESSKSSHEQSVIAHVRELDGVRGLAILFVLVYHLQPAILRVVGNWAGGIVGMGWAGVDLFFVLSGYLITSILLKTRGQSSALVNFYARRFLRIFPLYYVYLAFTFYIALPVLNQHGLLIASGRTGQAWYWLYLSNWYTSVRDGIPLTGHLWSLSIEEQFYIVWPFIVLTLPLNRLRALCRCAIIAVPLLRLGFAGFALHPEFIHRITVFRCDTLIWGALIAVERCLEKRSMDSWRRLSIHMMWVGTAAAVLSTILCGPSYSTWWGSTAGYSILCVAFAGVVLFAAASDGKQDIGAWILRRKPLVHLGKYSYGIYVIHVFVLAMAGRLAGQVAARLGWGSWMESVFYIVSGLTGTWIAALISWHLLEKHFQGLKGRWAYRSQSNESSSRGREQKERTDLALETVP